MKPGQQASGRYQLMMGPWYHVTAGEGIDMNRLELAWFDRWLKGKHDRDRPDQDARSTSTSSGSGKWLDASRYPLEGATPKTYYLRPGKSLAAARRRRAAGGSDQVVWTGLSSPCGLSTEQWGAGLLQLVLEQAGGSDPCAGDDSTTQVGPGAVTYTTAPFAKPQVLAGPDRRDALCDLEPARHRVRRQRRGRGAERQLEAADRRARSWARSESSTRASTWWAADGKPLLPYHPYTRASKQPVPTGKVTRYDIEVRPTFAKLAAGHRLRVTITTSDVPHIVPSPPQIANLAGGVYGIQHNSAAPLVPRAAARARRSAFTKACGICR